jgi:Fe-S oxidoreductase
MMAKAGPELVMSRRGTKSRRPADHGFESTDVRAFASRVVTFSQFLVRNEKEGLRRLISGPQPAEKVTYHDSCHHRHVLQAAEDSRDLVKLAVGSELIEMTGPAACCGFAGTFSVDHPEVAEALLSDKVAAVAASGADIVALDCPGCLLQIRGGCLRAGRAAEVRHTAEILASALKRRPSSAGRDKRV